MAEGGIAREAAMASTVIVLLLLIIVTPALMGERRSDISALPQVIVDRVDEETKVYVSGALSNYRYANISIVARDPSTWIEVGSVHESDVYASRLLLVGENGTYFSLWVLVQAVDAEFEYNATVEVVSEGKADVPATLMVQVNLGEDKPPWGSEAPFTDFIPRRELP
jgi:hypothetical protein